MIHTRKDPRYAPLVAKADRGDGRAHNKGWSAAEAPGTLMVITVIVIGAALHGAGVL
jgi:hypothetical protein